jgi:NADPH:quinone reductase-like Zn-dependent oxidoreductase
VKCSDAQTQVGTRRLGTSQAATRVSVWVIEAGSVMPAIDRVIALDQIPDAIRDFASGQVQGKIVIAT